MNTTLCSKSSKHAVAIVRVVTDTRVRSSFGKPSDS